VHRPDLIVTDHIMPRLTGLELCRALKSDVQLRNIPVILLSAALAPGDYGADEFLPKPFELGQFEGVVLAALGSRSEPVAARSARVDPRRQDVRAARWVADMDRVLKGARGAMSGLREELLPLAQAAERTHLDGLSECFSNLEQLLRSYARGLPAEDNLPEARVIDERLAGGLDGVHREHPIDDWVQPAWRKEG
jgi:two-component system, sensor histidine kinase and response regulator